MQKIKCKLFNIKTERTNPSSFNTVLSFNELENLSPVDSFSEVKLSNPEPIKISNLFSNTTLENVSKSSIFKATKVGGEYILNFMIPDTKLDAKDDSVILYSYYLTSIEESITDGYYILKFEDDDGNYISLCANKEITDKFDILRKIDLAIIPFVREKD